jgi:hypothetical protein
VFGIDVAIIAPSFVKAKESLRWLPQLELDVAECDFKFSIFLTEITISDLSFTVPFP